FKGAEANEPLRPQKDHRQSLVKNAIDEDCGREAGQAGFAALVGQPGNKPEEYKGSDSSQPLVPGPLIEAKPGPGMYRFKPGLRRGIEDPAKRNERGNRGGCFRDRARPP